jgi:hypothetical protein
MTAICNRCKKEIESISCTSFMLMGKRFDLCNRCSLAFKAALDDDTQEDKK